MIPVLLNTVRPYLVYLTRWFCNSGKKRRIFAFVGVLLLLVIIWLSRSDKVTHWKLKQRMKTYCNAPGPTISEEGHLTTFASPQFRLRHVQMVVRHGDRSPLLKEPSRLRTHPFDCSMTTNNKFHQNLLRRYIEMAPNFIIIRPPNAKTAKSVLPTLGECEPAQLTGIGFLQHIFLGKHFHQAYKDLMGPALRSDDEFHVCTTDHQRTMQSAAAFLTGFLDQSYIMTGRVSINASKDPWFREGSDGKVAPCPGLGDASRTFKASTRYQLGARELEVTMDKFSNLLDTPRKDLPSIVQMTDVLLASICHSHPFPCGPNGCVSPSLLYESLISADWSYYHNYSAISEILIHPLLQKLVNNVLQKIQEHDQQNFSFFFAHETTVLPLLLVLRDTQEIWPNYAIRFVMELWHDDFSADAGTDERDENELTDTDIEHYYLRFLLNGQAITEQISICRNIKFPEGLCPLTDMLEFMKNGYETMEMRYAKLCRLTS